MQEKEENKMKKIIISFLLILLTAGIVNAFETEIMDTNSRLNAINAPSFSIQNNGTNISNLHVNSTYAYFGYYYLGGTELTLWLNNRYVNNSNTTWITATGDTRYLNLTGKNANQNMNISPYSLEVNNLTVGGAVQWKEHTGIQNLFFINPLDGDGFRMEYWYDFEAANDDWLVFKKTDGNNAVPDGGIAFMMTNSSLYNRTILKLDGDGLANFTDYNIKTRSNITALDYCNATNCYTVSDFLVDTKMTNNTDINETNGYFSALRVYNKNFTANNGIFIGDGYYDITLGLPNARLGGYDSTPIYSGRLILEYFDGLGLNTVWQVDNGGNSLRFFDDGTVYGRVNESGFGTEYDYCITNGNCLSKVVPCANSSNINCTGGVITYNGSIGSGTTYTFGENISGTGDVLSLNISCATLTGSSTLCDGSDADTNAGTICDGTTTYLDGGGECDDISTVYWDACIDAYACGWYDSCDDVTACLTWGGNLTGTGLNPTLKPCVAGQILEYSAGGWICGVDDQATVDLAGLDIVNQTMLQNSTIIRTPNLTNYQLTAGAWTINNYTALAPYNITNLTTHLANNPVNTTKDFNVNYKMNVTANDGNVVINGNLTVSGFKIYKDENGNFII
jgi:hypothetical protein